jgi:hypothetical protein
VNGTFNASAQPPPISSPAWDLQDGGAWRSTNSFPIYAIPTDIGDQLMQELSLYSGNMTEVPNGHEISELPNVDPRDYVRMYTAIHTTSNSNMPNLWVFLLIVVAILVLMLAGTSVAMHMIQRARRNSLRRRILNREVDLEALGIKRLTVPHDIIEKCPLFTYNCEDEKPPPQIVVGDTDNSAQSSQSAEEISEVHEVPQSAGPRPASAGEIISNHSSLTHTFLPYSQPTCPICLEDFKSGVTPIRELPCGHIFHPECIDSFLSNNSSLCPMCKKSVLPQGYCPTPITNAIVRRERNLRRLRSRVTINEAGGVQNTGSRIQRLNANARSIFHRSSAGGNVPQAQSSIPLQPQPVLVADATTLNPRASVLGNEVISTVQGSLSRQQLAQRRIQELAARRSSELMDEASDGQRSKCTCSANFCPNPLLISVQGKMF